MEDCHDGADEAICECNPLEHFKCSSGQCIDKSYRCDTGEMIFLRFKLRFCV